MAYTSHYGVSTSPRAGCATLTTSKMIQTSLQPSLVAKAQLEGVSKDAEVSSSSIFAGMS